MRTLVIAGETPARHSLRRELVIEGWDVILADDEELGMMRAESESLDAIVLDADTPDLDALHLCRLLRRADDHTRIRELELDGEERVARIGDRTVPLTRTEFQLLELFMLNPRRVLSAELIYDRVWGYDFGPGGNTLRVYVGYLRRKLEAGGERRLLHTVRGVGYVLRQP